MRAFVDTNLWVYRVDHREAGKREFTRDWMRRLAEEHEIVVSTQVLIEFRSAASKKLSPALSAPALEAALRALARFDVVPTDENLILDAHVLAVTHRLAWFDALIIEAAIRSRCDRLFSEDLDHGRRFEQLTIVNPFRNA